MRSSRSYSGKRAGASPGSPDDEHGATGLVQHAARHASQHGARDPAAAVRADDNQVGVDRVRIGHERTRAAADATSPVPVRQEPGALCSPAELTRAETVALTRLAAFPAGTAADATKSAVDAAVRAAFGSAPCRGLEYASEQARLFYSGIQPRTLLMPGTEAASR